MKPPIARTLGQSTQTEETRRAPRSFAPETLTAVETEPPIFDTLVSDAIEPAPSIRRMSLWARLAWGTGAFLVSLGLALAAERLIRDLFARYEVLGWAGLAALALFVMALAILIGREVIALRRLRNLHALRNRGTDALAGNDLAEGRAVLRELETIYAARPDLARPRETLGRDAGDLLDGAEIIRLAERRLMAPLDRRARALTAASARRVALVTAVSPRALVDIAFVVYESVRLGGAIARLYGARPGFLGSWRLFGAVLGHLAVTGGLAASDGLVEQLVGHGLAAKLSKRLGEGVVNGLMTVRVGIAAIRVVRPLAFETERQPVVREFLPELANVAAKVE
ncbi:YcjF family protein [Arsenicitalea aurantiaca]|uniref:YcjF family protein n=1 Tax=Arsenicitalea aurantiaca TaxID=1783274 RepID=UPI001FCEB42C|nr:TIGR01620 family protein [Arsenicitalea aurantiaca]